MSRLLLVLLLSALALSDDVDIADDEPIPSKAVEPETLLEDDEGMDTEVMFLAILVVAITALIAFALWSWISSKALKRSAKVEPTRTVNGTSENKYATAAKKAESPNKSERADGSVNRRQGKK